MRRATTRMVLLGLLAVASACQDSPTEPNELQEPQAKQEEAIVREPLDATTRGFIAAAVADAEARLLPALAEGPGRSNLESALRITAASLDTDLATLAAAHLVLSQAVDAFEVPGSSDADIDALRLLVKALGARLLPLPVQ